MVSMIANNLIFLLLSVLELMLLQRPFYFIFPLSRFCYKSDSAPRATLPLYPFNGDQHLPLCHAITSFDSSILVAESICQMSMVICISLSEERQVSGRIITLKFFFLVNVIGELGTVYLYGNITF